MSTVQSALIISGGDPDGTAGQTVEVYVPATGQQCLLADLPDVRRVHSMEAKTVCGGSRTLTSCITLTSAGTWEITSTLLEKR